MENTKYLKIGDKTQITKSITEEEVIVFAKISGDDNPIHLNEEYAKNSIFKQKIVHGFLVGSLISAAIGKNLPGNGTIYLNQNMKFLAPVLMGEIITAYIEVVDFPKGNQVLLSTICKNQDQKVVIDGTALVIAPKETVLVKKDATVSETL